MELSFKKIFIGALSIVFVIFALVMNPFSWNTAGERIVVEKSNGDISVQFQPGMFYAGFFSKETEWPNQISVKYTDSVANYELIDNTIDIGKISIRFGGGDASTAYISGIVQFVLPNDEKDMIEMHVTHRTPQSLVTKRLAPYTKECLQSSAQMMTSEMHYSGGRATMSQDFFDQLKNGVFLLKTIDKIQYDSLEKENKRVYETYIIKDVNGNPKRKNSSIKEYGITIADAAITDVDYEDRVDAMLAKKIDAATKASVSKQELITAQQQMLTAKAQGEKDLVETEYKKRQEQLTKIVAAQTDVELAEQDRKKQEVAYQAAILEAKKTKELADAEAYKKRKLMEADGALQARLDAYVKVQLAWAEAFANYEGNVVPTMYSGSGVPMNGFNSLVDMLAYKTAKEMNVELNMKK